MFTSPELPYEVSRTFFSRRWCCAPIPCILRKMEGLTNSQARTKHSWVCIKIPLCLKVCWSSHSLCPTLQQPFHSDLWSLIEWAQSARTTDVYQYVICTTTVHCDFCCLPLGKSCPVLLIWWSQRWTTYHLLMFVAISLTLACPWHLNCYIVLYRSSCSLGKVSR